LKLSGESFQVPGFGIDAETFTALPRSEGSSDLGIEMAIIVGGGNIFRGRAKNPFRSTRHRRLMGMWLRDQRTRAEDALEKQGVSRAS